ncbi:hypothetical protein TrLO_g12611 [Triparma laevis f. longispina]|uniref:Transmembrane protein n=1 Tax=Triparma laevis f. longispina TaxID=1714387 RepID=A0A9W6ZCT5_9STRA|nr:hypothetical protein TrLO_g12611 [Triparma laevis f. longispina]
MPELATPFTLITSEPNYLHRPGTPPLPKSPKPSKSSNSRFLDVEWSVGGEMHSVESIILPLSVLTFFHRRIFCCSPTRLMTLQHLLLVVLFFVIFWLAWNLTPNVEWEEVEEVYNDDTTTTTNNKN